MVRVTVRVTVAVQMRVLGRTMEILSGMITVNLRGISGSTGMGIMRIAIMGMGIMRIAIMGMGIMRITFMVKTHQPLP